MSDHLLIIIDYISNNLQFGSMLDIEKVEELLKRYPISCKEEELVFAKLNSLNINIIYSKQSLEEKVSRLFKYIGSKKELRETKLNEWFEIEKINYVMQNKIRHSLNVLGYTVINDIHKDINFNDFSFLDEIDSNDLDTILDDDCFNNEVSKLKNVVDKGHNLEYLIDFHCGNGDLKKRKQALDNIVNANKKLVWKVVSKYEQFSTVSFDVNDMYQVGMLGLMKAAEKFDINRKSQFSTYAILWIRQIITRSIADYSTTIRIPVHMRQRIIKYIRIKNEFWNENGRVASKEEIANLLSINSNEISNLQRYQYIGNLASLDATIGADKESFLGEFIQNNQQQLPEEYAEENALKNEIREIREKRLTPKEARILNLRFGLVDGRPHTLEEIGHLENLTRERIRQIEAKAIKKLQNPKVLERLRDFYYDRK